MIIDESFNGGSQFGTRGTAGRMGQLGQWDSWLNRSVAALTKKWEFCDTQIVILCKANRAQNKAFVIQVSLGTRVLSGLSLG